MKKEGNDERKYIKEKKISLAFIFYKITVKLGKFKV